MAKIYSFCKKLEEKKGKDRQKNRVAEAHKNDWVFKTSSFLVRKIIKKELSYMQASNLVRFLSNYLPIENSSELLKNKKLLATIHHKNKSKFPPLRCNHEIDDSIIMLKEAVFRNILSLQTGIRMLVLCTEYYNLQT